MKDKPRLTREELSRIRSEAGRKGAAATKANNNFKGGRPKGASSKNPSTAIPVKTLTVREPDYQVFVRLAGAKNIAIVEFVHLVAESLKAKNPKFFKPSAEPVV